MSITVLGAGPAGLGAALWLAERGTDVTLLEQNELVGGNAGSFEVAGVRVDFGSHRLHPAADPGILADLRKLLGDDLLTRPRHGRIRLLGRWIHFPLRAPDLVLRLHPRFAIGAGLDAVGKALRPAPPASDRDSFATILQAGLGRTICREFYFPYARKIWGLEPDEISPIQARRRVSASSIGKLLRRLLPGTGSGGQSTKGVFYYPRLGFGQISEMLRDAAAAAGADIRLETAVKGLMTKGDGYRVELAGPAGPDEITADRVWSTIPLPVLARLHQPEPRSEVLSAARSLELRAMLLVYVVLEQPQFSEFDAHYFPEADLPFTRVSEPKNYAARSEPQGRTVLCAEIPCSLEDEVWTMDDDALGELVSAGLEQAGLPVRAPVLQTITRRLPHAYPIYRRGYEQHFATLDSWLEGQDRLLSFGRQGLYAHDNTHHALYMAKCAVACVTPDGGFDRQEWSRYRRIFETHVVED